MENKLYCFVKKSSHLLWHWPWSHNDLCFYKTSFHFCQLCNWSVLALTLAIVLTFILTLISSSLDQLFLFLFCTGPNLWYNIDLYFLTLVSSSHDQLCPWSFLTLTMIWPVVINNLNRNEAALPMASNFINSLLQYFQLSLI